MYIERKENRSHFTIPQPRFVLILKFLELEITNGKTILYIPFPSVVQVIKTISSTKWHFKNVMALLFNGKK